MLSRLTPAARCVRLMTLPNPFAAVVPSSDNGIWMSSEDRDVAVSAFSAKQAAAGIKSWNIVPQNVYDPVIKAGLGMIVGFQDFIPHRIAGQCSEEVLEKTLNIYTEMKADGAKAYEIRATIGPIFMEHAKEIEAARTDQVPRIRRFNFAVEDLKFLYSGPVAQLDGTSYIQGSRLEHAWSYFNGVKASAPTCELHGHPFGDQPLMENQDELINNMFLKNEVWAHSGEHPLALTHPGWTAAFVLEAEDANGNMCSVPVAYPLNTSGGFQAFMPWEEETVAKLAAATTAAEKHEIAMADKSSATYVTMLQRIDDAVNKNGDSRPNPTKNFLCRVFGVINGAGTPSQQVAKYQADQATIDKFSSWQNEVGVYPANTASSLNDLANFDSKRHTAKFNTQTIYGRVNYGRMVSSLAGTGILLALL